MNPEQVYNTVNEVCGHMSEIYEDYIIYLVGYEGLYVLQENGFIECCGKAGGRKLYTLM